MSDEPKPPVHEEGVADILAGMDPMWLAACVLGFNEMAKSAKTLGDKIYFRSFRDLVHEALRSCPDPKGWSIEFKEST